MRTEQLQCSEKKAVFASLVNKEAPHIIVTHWSLHKILSTRVNVINFVRFRALHQSIFKMFCQQMGERDGVLL